MNIFKKKYRFILVGAVLTAFGRIIAGPFDTDISDWSADENNLCTKSEDADFLHNIHIIQKKMGIQKTIEFEVGEKDCHYCPWNERKADPTYHHIALKPSTMYFLSKSTFTRYHSDAKLYHMAMAIACHEMGHAKHTEDTRYVNQRITLLKKFEELLHITCPKTSDKKLLARLKVEQDRLRYEDELYADAAIPDEKPLVLAMRDLELYSHKQLLADAEWKYPEYLKAIAEIDFSVPMVEKNAKAWDQVHKDNNDIHPSSYRRAYLFNERLQKLEAQERKRERELCDKIAQHVTMLTMSDILS